MIATLFLACVAHAGGGGALLEVSPGAAWSNHGGPLVQGNSLHFDVDAFWGPYEGTLMYGPHTRAGLQIGARTAPLLAQDLIESTLFVAPEVGRGIDLLRIGAYWKVAVGPTIRVIGEDVRDEALVFGVGSRGTLGGVYWLFPNVGLVARFEGGPEWVEDRGTSFTGGMGFGIIGRIGYRKKPEPEQDPWIYGGADVDPVEEPSVSAGGDGGGG